MTKIFIIISLLSAFQSVAIGKEFKSTEKPLKLIELFSSEGCSSCPPAEDQLANLTNHNDLWKTFAPINFHVDYWNRLGWVDPYSNAEFTERQHKYAKSWGVGTVYTPAFVANGKSLGPTLKYAELANDSENKSSLKVSLDANLVKKVFVSRLNATNLDPKKVYDVHIALLGNGLVSNVTSGENEGKILTQNFVALKYEKKAYQGKQVSFEFKQPENLNVSKYGIVAWLTEKDKLTPLQVVGGYL